MKKKLQKIQAMLDSPFEGERQNAKDMLERLMEEHNITESDLKESEEAAIFSFPYFNKWEKKLLIQILCRVLDTQSVSLYRTNKKRQLRVRLTMDQFAKADMLYKHYRKSLRKEIDSILENALGVFFSKNDLYFTAKDEDPDVEIEVSEKDLEMMRALWSAISDIRLPNKYLRIE